jgi:hypothetical protein
MDAELAGGIGGGGDDTALVGASADDDGLALEGRIEEFLDGDEEGVHVEMEAGFHVKEPPGLF